MHIQTDFSGEMHAHDLDYDIDVQYSTIEIPTYSRILFEKTFHLAFPRLHQFVEYMYSESEAFS